MDGWMYGWMVELMAMAIAIVMATCQRYITSSTEASNPMDTTASTLAAITVTAAYGSTGPRWILYRLVSPFLSTFELKYTNLTTGPIKSKNI